MAVQIHGGYGYTTEYLPEAYMRDQKLNSIHEGTSGIQSMDLLGRKVMAKGGAALHGLAEEILATVNRARTAGCDAGLCDALAKATDDLVSLTAELGQRGMAGDTDGMLGHSFDYLDMMSVLVVAWQWLQMEAIARERFGSDPAKADQLHGIQAATQYWIRTEVPRMAVLGELCRSSEDSYLKAEAAWL